MRTIKLGDICQFVYGKSLTSKQRNLGNIKVYGSNGEVGNHDLGYTEGATIIIGRKGSIGEVHLSQNSCWPIDTTYYIDRNSTTVDIEWLYFRLIALRLDKLNRASGVPGLNREDAYKQLITEPRGSTWQRDQVLEIKEKLSSFETAKCSLNQQLDDIQILSYSIIRSSLSGIKVESKLSDCLEEVKGGIGENWKDYRVLGATRNGLALAKEPPGKKPERYKPVTPGTVFYNPMRIMIGSIAFADSDDEPGITSPDYVVLKGKEGVVDSRWFYYWMRSPLGERCIQSLSRGAVRERMLFNRLAEGEIELPDYDTQLKASQALAEIKPMQTAIEAQLKELELIPQKLLAQIFES
ncbi:restriction endonuclease subunit S [Rubritalea spongiae]|uniref:Restriction endonuclease subunit S n=1 Tax=Rubritalea spongiae TaxID=430797 RepID=A0ABW5DZ04_9BACT